METRTERTRFDPVDLRRRWVQVPAGDPQVAAERIEGLGVDFAAANGRVWETDDFVYLPVVVNLRTGDTISREAVVFALGHDVLVTLQPEVRFAPFDKAVARMRRTPHLAGSPHGVMYALLYALNEAAERVIDYASDALEAMTDEIDMATKGVDENGRDIGVMDMQDTIARMNEAEEIVSRSQESQLLLARAARYLRAETAASEVELGKLIDILIADIDGVKEHASFEHDKVRYLQQSIMTSLDVKQNQIVKVFTIITAVFLPPTLIATFYGMNFTWMPELEWEHGFLVTTLLTLVAALIPLAYIKRKGWLR
ncbi:magnesium transporter CorA [Prauserella sp. PE36]|uniref:Magnesium transporter n=2 Tax=Pseudonocardiaceae TaxID=2070 RepID=A0A1I1CKN5_9PSEU|nr:MULTISPECIES: CorA family divalent cation transporter [Amycolatopsis]RBM17634.1 magnesium transporter CorA [Prauserella sp. PE36]TKG60086.1 magnesium transporter CorA [Prauserella endophytica]TWE15029.1 magnesium transporter [Prauserella muralis]SFB63231.1 magnesium transporter [Amycolatopsis marina]